MIRQQVMTVLGCDHTADDRMCAAGLAVAVELPPAEVAAYAQDRGWSTSPERCPKHRGTAADR